MGDQGLRGFFCRESLSNSKGMSSYRWYSVSRYRWLIGSKEGQTCLMIARFIWEEEKSGVPLRAECGSPDPTCRVRLCISDGEIDARSLSGLSCSSSEIGSRKWVGLWRLSLFQRTDLCFPFLKFWRPDDESPEKDLFLHLCLCLKCLIDRDRSPLISGWMGRLDGIFGLFPGAELTCWSWLIWADTDLAALCFQHTAVKAVALFLGRLNVASPSHVIWKYVARGYLPESQATSMKRDTDLASNFYRYI